MGFGRDWKDHTEEHHSFWVVYWKRVVSYESIFIRATPYVDR